ncbi:chromatin modification- protein VID21 [Thoreauomyces humboldtii]|nr:chromatin modification- protein VID21 [Thoreauomyces humboldtii]
MVTRGVTAKKLAISPDTPTGPSVPAVDITIPLTTGPTSSSATVVRRRSSTVTKTPAARTPAITAIVKTPRTKTRAQDVKAEPRKRTPLRKNGALIEANSELGGYRWYEWQLRVQANPIGALLPTASKALTTKDWQAARNEAQQLSLLSKVEQLKEKRLWSFRQLKPHDPPQRLQTHWDALLDEMKWMRTDFRQERRLKIATAYHMAQWVMEWHASTDKPSLCIDRRPSSIDRAATPETPSVRRASNAMIIDNPDVTRRRSSADVREAGEVGSEPLSDQTPMFMDVDATFHIIDDGGNAPNNPGLPTYVPLRLDEPYVDENHHKRIVPVSKLISERRVIVDDCKRGAEDDPMREVSQSLESPGPHDAVPAYTPLFAAPTKPVLVPTILPPASPAPSSKARQTPEWSSVEDADLLYLASAYQHNWTIVADMLFSRQMAGLRWRRSDWECFLRFRELPASGLGVTKPAATDALPSSSGMPKSAQSGLGTIPSSSEVLDPRIAQHFATIESIRSLSKNKDPLKRAERKLPLKIVLTTHETHFQAQTTAGIDPNGVPLTPAELAAVKRARLAQQAQEHGRQMFGSHPRGAVLLGRAPPMGLPNQLAYQFRGARPPGGLLPMQAPLMGGQVSVGGAVPQHSAMRPSGTPIMAGQLAPHSPSMARLNATGALPLSAQEQYLRAAMLARQQQMMNASPQQQRAALSPQSSHIGGDMQIDVNAQLTPTNAGRHIQNPGAASMNQRLQMAHQQQQHVLSLQQQQQLHKHQHQQQLQAQQQQQQQQQSSPQQPMQGILHQQQSSPQQQQQMPPQRVQEFADAPHTAAAFVALQNAQQVAKMGQVRFVDAGD